MSDNTDRGNFVNSHIQNYLDKLQNYNFDCKAYVYLLYSIQFININC